MGSTADAPGASSSFLGRGEELAELVELLERSRLITLTGAPGVGKTRLARELAGARGEPAVLVELAAVSDPLLVPRALAVALSLPEVPGQSVVDSVTAHLGERRVLLVLDNCEHLIDGCAELVASLLGGCPEVSVLATSRERLGLEAERVWEVAPLAVPDRGMESSPDALMGCPSSCLFVQRAGAVQAGFVLNSYVAPDVAEICRRLDGIPLAIELAAARVDMLTPAEIARRLDARFELLTEPGSSSLARHQTLEAALEWSYGLLSPAEGALLRGVSVFVGGFGVEAAETVCAGGEVKPSRVPELLAALVSKSLITADADQSPARYRLLETIRAYASARLEQAGEAAELREAHARFYLALAERAEPELTGPDQAGWLGRLDSERDNLRRALEWSLGHAHGDWALRLAGALVLFWRVRCHFTEGKELLEATLAASEREASALRAKALWGAGFMSLMAGDPQGAVAPLEESLAAFREHNDLRGAARALLILANRNQSFNETRVLPLLEESATLAREAGDSWCLAHALGVAGFENERHGSLPAARSLFEECLSVARAADDRQGLRLGLIGLGSVALEQGDYCVAEGLLQQGVAIARELDEDYSRAEALQHLGRLALGRGNYVEARKLLTEALALIADIGPRGVGVGVLVLMARADHAAGDRSGARRRFDNVLRSGAARPATAVLYMGDLAVDEGELEEGRCLLEEVLAWARALGYKHFTAEALHGLGRLARDAGDAGRAVALQHEALELQRQMGAAPAVVASVEALAGLTAAAGRHHRAARLLGAANTLRQENGYARWPWEAARYAADVKVARQGLAAADFEIAFVRGANLSVADAGAQAGKSYEAPGRPANGWESLTPAERKVATLVAEGLTNRVVAERLFLAPNTVKRHLSHVFSKLSIARRSELAALVSRRGQPRDG